MVLQLFLRLRARLDDLAGGAVRLSAARRAGGRRFPWARPRIGPFERPVAAAACRFRGHERAQVRVTAHTFRSAAVCRVWWVPKIKSRASGGLLGKGRLRSDSQGGGPQRFGFVASFRTELRRVVGRRSLLVVAQCSGSLAASAPEGSRLVRWYQAASLLLWCCFVRPDTTGPACLGKPRRRGEEPRTRHPYGEKDPPKDMAGSNANLASQLGGSLSHRSYSANTPPGPKTSRANRSPITRYPAAVGCRPSPSSSSASVRGSRCRPSR